MPHRSPQAAGPVPRSMACSPNATPPASGIERFTYTMGGVAHVVWMSDAAAVRGLPGLGRPVLATGMNVALWRLGTEDHRHLEQFEALGEISARAWRNRRPPLVPRGIEQAVQVISGDVEPIPVAAFVDVDLQPLDQGAVLWAEVGQPRPLGCS